MKVVIVSQWFPPEPAPIGHMLKELAEEFAARGWQVTIVTGFPNHPLGTIFPGYHKSLFKKEHLGSVHIWRVFLATSSRRTVFSRMLTFMTFTWFSTWAILRRSQPDIIFGVLQPLSVGLTLPIVASLKRAKLIFGIQDLHPDAQIRAGLVRNSLFIRFLKWLEKHSYAKADGLITICDSFSQHCIRLGANNETTVAIPNWIDLDAVRPSSRINKFRKQLGCPTETKVVLFAGTVGLASGAEIILDAAAMLKGKSDVLFVFVGEGALLASLKARAAADELDNVVFAPFQPRETLNEVQAVADVSLVVVRPGFDSSSVPSKVLGYMAGGRPIVACVDPNSETAALVRNAECGILVAPSDAVGLARAIEDILSDPGAIENYGRNGRRFLEKNRTKREATDRYAKFIESVVG